MQVMFACALESLSNRHIQRVASAGADSADAHLEALLRHARDPQRREHWRVECGQVTKRLGQRPLWLSTAVVGVACLHVRLDSPTKDYGPRPGTQAPQCRT